MPLLGAVTARAAPPPASLKLLSYYDYPPFHTGPGEGLSAELAQWLGPRAEPQLAGVDYELLPRRRVDALVRQPGWQGLVPWVSPGWFQPADPQRFVWTPALLNDEDLVLSPKRRPLDFDGPASLRGRILGGIYGHVYTDADPMVGRGELTRMDSFSQEANLRGLLIGRVDALFLSRSGLAWWRQRVPDFDSQVHVAAQPRMRYQRHLLLPRSLPEALRETLLQLCGQLGNDPAWREVLRRYGLQALTAERAGSDLA